MARVIVKRLKNKRPSKADTTSVSEKRVTGRDGRVLKVLTLEVSSRTFDNDLQYVFQRNVAKARRENRKVTGVGGRAPVKG